MSTAYQVLIDSDTFVGQISKYDVHHQKVIEIFSQLEKRNEEMVTTNMVVAETATLLSYRFGQDLAKLFLDTIEKSGLHIIHVDGKYFQEGIEIFKRQTIKRTSMVDCTNAAVMYRLGIPYAFSFDEVYGKKFGLKYVQDLLK